MLQEIRQFGCEEVIGQILELSVIVEENSVHSVGRRLEEVVIRWGKIWTVQRMWKNPEWSLSSCLQCVVGTVTLKNHSMSSTWAILLDCFLQMARLLTIVFSSDGQVPLKQFIMECHSC
jgi:hypothetical protein